MISVETTLLNALIDYVGDVKPYHVKVRELTNELLFSDQFKLQVSDDARLDVYRQSTWTSTDPGGLELYRISGGRESTVTVGGTPYDSSQVFRIPPTTGLSVTYNDPFDTHLSRGYDSYLLDALPYDTDASFPTGVSDVFTLSSASPLSTPISCVSPNPLSRTKAQLVLSVRPTGSDAWTVTATGSWTFAVQQTVPITGPIARANFKQAFDNGRIRFTIVPQGPTYTVSSPSLVTVPPLGRIITDELGTWFVLDQVPPPGTYVELGVSQGAGPTEHVLVATHGMPPGGLVTPLPIVTISQASFDALAPPALDTLYLIT